VAKHGNRGVSSSSGSSDVLSALGVTIDLPPEAVAACLDEVGIGFCFAPLFHSAMKHAAGVRRQLGLRTIFNLVGPLTNPAGAGCQLLGGNSDRAARLLAGALKTLGRPRALVVCGNNELDEVALWGTTLALEVDGARGEITEHSWTAADFGLAACEVGPLTVDSPEESAALIRDVLQGQPGAARDIVVANTAAALLAFESGGSLIAAAERAANAIDDGTAAAKLASLVEVSGRLAA
jgi:anthranilate phosphoribosyltransferase